HPVARLKLTHVERMAAHVQIADHNPQLLAEVPFQQKIGVPRRAVLCCEDEAFLPAADVRTQCVHNLNRNRNVSDRILRLRRLNPSVPNGLTYTHEFPERVYVANTQSAKFTRTHSSLDRQPVEQSLGTS